MATKKDWKYRHLQLDRKAQRVLYLSDEHWDWLKNRGNGSATLAVREIISSYQNDNVNLQDDVKKTSLKIL